MFQDFISLALHQKCEPKCLSLPHSEKNYGSQLFFQWNLQNITANLSYTHVGNGGNLL